MVVLTVPLICLGLLSMMSSTFVADSECCDAGTGQESETCGDLDTTSKDDKTSHALMLYEPMPFLEPFHKESRSFMLSGHQIKIQQNWAELGVAAVVWDAAVVLSEYLEEEVTNGRLCLSGKKIIELGAGTGLVTMAVALLGGEVISTDRKAALGILQGNIEENFKGDLAHLKNLVTVSELNWGEKLEEISTRFDLILGADIVYVEQTFEKLLATIRHLSYLSTRVLLSCRIRYDRDVRFLDMLRGFYSVSRILRDEPRGIDIYEAIVER